MKSLLVALIMLAAGASHAADIFPEWGWELYLYNVPFRSSPISFGAGSATTVSSAIVTETNAERQQDNLPSRGIYGKGWPAAAQIDLTRFIEFAIDHTGDRPFYLGYVAIPLFREAPDTHGRGEQGPKRWALRWSRDNYQSNLGPEFDLSSNNDRSEAIYRVDLLEHPPTSATVTFRLYGYDSPSPEGSGGILPVTRKLYLRGATRPPLTGIPPRIVYFTPTGSTCALQFEGSYGATYGLERSRDFQTWLPGGVADTTVDEIDNLDWFFSIPKQSDTPFLRVIQR